MATLYVNKSGKSNPTTAGRVFMAVEVSGITTAPAIAVNYVITRTYTIAYTELSGVAPNISGTIWFYGADTILPTSASGTMTKSGGGVGDASITYNAWYRVGTNTTYPSSNFNDVITFAAQFDTIVVGSGSYNERITIANKSLSLLADGVVVVDGTGLSGTGSGITFSNVSGASANAPFTYILDAYSNGGKWILKNHSTPGDTYGALDLRSYNQCTFSAANVEIFGNVNNRTGIAVQNTGSNSPAVSSVSKVFVSGCSAYGIFIQGLGAFGGTSFLYLNSSTIYNCGYGVYFSTISGITGINKNIFHTCTTAIRAAGTPTARIINYNDYYNNTNAGDYNSTLYTTLASLQAINLELNGTFANPNLIDPANGVAYVSSQTLYGAYPYSSATQGLAYDPYVKWIITAVQDDTGWYNADGNITKNATTNEFELSNGVSGVIESPVYDIGSVQTIIDIAYVANETWPTNMVDKDKTDVMPNKQQVEVRADANSFVQASVSPSWITCNAHSLLTSPVGRYVQVRLTLRNDDVGA